MPQRQHARHRGSRMQVDALPDVVAQRPGVVDQPGSARHVLRPARLGEPLRQPHPEVHSAATSVGSGLQVAQQRPRTDDRDAHPARWGHEQQEAGQDPPPADRRGPRHQVQTGGDIVGDRHPDHPLHPGQRRQRNGQRDLHGLSPTRHRLDGPRLDSRGWFQFVEVSGQRPQPRVVVEVGDGHLRIALPQPGDQLRGGQRSAAEGEEVRLRPVDLCGQHVAPQSGQPARRTEKVGCVRTVTGSVDRPRQRVAVHLARRAGGQLADEDQPGHQGRGQ